MDTAAADRRLRLFFHFESVDLEANRAGRLSPSQVTRFRRARWGGWLAIAVLVATTTLGLARQTRASQPEALSHGWVVAVAIAVAAIAYVASRSSLRALEGRRIEVAEGPLTPLAENWVRVGETLLPLGAPGAAQAFESGAAYRLFYVKGPRALVLSGEALGAGSRPAERR